MMAEACKYRTVIGGGDDPPRPSAGGLIPAAAELLPVGLATDITGLVGTLSVARL
jgi:hypothetical protein